MKLLAGMVVAVLLGLAPAAAQEAMGPDALAKSVTDEVIAVLKSDKELQSGSNSAKVIELVEKKVLPHFDFVRMTRLAAGANWRQASPAQRDSLVQEFRTLLVHTYASTFTGYRDQAVEYRPVRMQPGDTDAVVRSLIRTSSGKPVAVDYRMERKPDGWKVYDVVVADLSLVQNYRGTFESEVRKGGVDGLIKSLVEKNRQLAAGQSVAASK